MSSLENVVSNALGNDAWLTNIALSRFAEAEGYSLRSRPAKWVTKGAEKLVPLISLKIL
ncbi:hypothetical protein D3C81_1353370 [compost metagenome]